MHTNIYTHTHTYRHECNHHPNQHLEYFQHPERYFIPLLNQ